MVLKVAKRKAVSQNPSTLLMYGPPKIGKTTMLSSLDKCLIIDTESGSNMIEGHILNANNRVELIDILKQAREGHEFKYIAIDTIDKVVQWAEEAVCQENSVQALADLPFGKGWGLARDKVMNTIHAFKDVCDHLIIVGHRKTAKAVVEGQATVEPESLDITGRLKNMIMSDSDAIGYVFRDEDEKLMISFKSDDALEAGSRSPHLRGKILPFDWKHIYKKEAK
jgi:energy-coupling factor transporter ATP-binding protein EcfA2